MLFLNLRNVKYANLILYTAFLRIIFTEYASKFNEDKRNINSVFSQLFLVNPVVFKLIRIGKANSTSSLPMIRSLPVKYCHHSTFYKNTLLILYLELILFVTKLASNEKSYVIVIKNSLAVLMKARLISLIYQTGLKSVTKLRSKNSNPVRHLIHK